MNTIDIAVYEHPEYRHNRFDSPPLNITKLMDSAGSNEIVIRVSDCEANGYVYKFPIEQVAQVRASLDSKYVDEHYSVRVVSEHIETTLLRKICGS